MGRLPRPSPHIFTLDPAATWKIITFQDQHWYPRGTSTPGAKHQFNSHIVTMQLYLKKKKALIVWTCEGKNCRKLSASCNKCNLFLHSCSTIIQCNETKASRAEISQVDGGRCRVRPGFTKLGFNSRCIITDTHTQRPGEMAASVFLEKAQELTFYFFFSRHHRQTSEDHVTNRLLVSATKRGRMTSADTNRTCGLCPSILLLCRESSSALSQL